MYNTDAVVSFVSTIDLHSSSDRVSVFQPSAMYCRIGASPGCAATDAGAAPCAPAFGANAEIANIRTSGTITGDRTVPTPRRKMPAKGTWTFADFGIFPSGEKRRISFS